MSEYEMILSCNYDFLMDSSKDITSEQLRPTVQVSYIREPYI